MCWTWDISETALLSLSTSHTVLVRDGKLELFRASQKQPLECRQFAWTRMCSAVDMSLCATETSLCPSHGRWWSLDRRRSVIPASSRRSTVSTGGRRRHVPISSTETRKGPCRTVLGRFRCHVLSSVEVPDVRYRRHFAVSRFRHQPRAVLQPWYVYPIALRQPQTATFNQPSTRTS